MRPIAFWPIVLILLLGCGSGSTPPPPPPPHPNEQAVERAEKQADEAKKIAVEARQQVVQTQRLREIDRIKHDAEVVQATGETVTYRTMNIYLAVVMLILMLWMVREIRIRRVLSRVLTAVRSQHKGGDT